MHIEHMFGLVQLVQKEEQIGMQFPNEIEYPDLHNVQSVGELHWLQFVEHIGTQLLPILLNPVKHVVHVFGTEQD